MSRVLELIGLSVCLVWFAMFVAAILIIFVFPAKSEEEMRQENLEKLSHYRKED